MWTEIDGVPVLPDQELPLGKEFSSSYSAFLAFHGGDLAQLGAAVGGAVFPGAHGAAVEALCAAAPQRGEGVRLVFETAAPELLALPFEAARLPGGLVPVLEPGVRVLRRHAKALAPPLIPIPGPLRILAAVGAPDERRRRTPSSITAADLRRRMCASAGSAYARRGALTTDWVVAHSLSLDPWYLRAVVFALAERMQPAALLSPLARQTEARADALR